MNNWLSYLRTGTRSLKTTFALYFIPVSIIPMLSVSFYAIRLFENNANEALIQRARSERDAIEGEFDSVDSQLKSQTRDHAISNRLLLAVKGRNEIGFKEALGVVPVSVTIRAYAPDGSFLFGKGGEQSFSRIDYLSKEGLKEVRRLGETLNRYYTPNASGFVSIARQLLKDGNHVYGVIEEEHHFGAREFADLRNRRQVDVILLNKELEVNGASFALNVNDVNVVSKDVFQQTLKDQKKPSIVEIGGNRYASFMDRLPAKATKGKQWGYLVVLLSMESVDGAVTSLKLAMLYLTILLMFMAMLAIFLFSNRLVKPIEALVSAMKRVKTGRVEEIPNIDSAYEVEYLVRSFNEMTRNVVATKRALEVKLEELRKANSEIKQTQSTLVQSAKMISLGQIVAGVAHELNNPIAFIYSNMHHLTEYMSKISTILAEYRVSSAQLPEKEKQRIEQLEKDLEIEFILKDINDLTQSCVDGAERTKEIVSGLRTFSRMDEATFKFIDIHDGLRSTLKLLSAEIKGRVSVHLDFGEIPLVEANLSQLNQVFMNLLSNAAHAIDGKGEIFIRTHSVDRSIEIEFEDTGRGMSEDTMEKIFDPFFTTKQVGQGTGLGLSIAYGLIQKHKGTISVRSILGKGTTFIVRLPVKQTVD